MTFQETDLSYDEQIRTILKNPSFSLEGISAKNDILS